MPMPFSMLKVILMKLVKFGTVRAGWVGVGVSGGGGGSVWPLLKSYTSVTRWPEYIFMK
jgi:hypothetical protein